MTTTSEPELAGDIALNLLADLQRRQREGTLMAEPEQQVPVGEERDMALMIAALVQQAGGRVVIDPARFREVQYVNLGIQYLDSGAIEFTVRAEEAW